MKTRRKFTPEFKSEVVRRWLPEPQMVWVVDGGLAAIKLGQRCRSYANPVTYVSRLRLDAGLYDWPGPQPTGKRGPNPKKGARQAALKACLHDPATVWRTITSDWYRGERRTLEITSGTALWYTPGQDPLPLRWVLVRDPLGKLLPAAFFATDLMVTPEQILAWVVMRWGIEVPFEEAHVHLGLETQRQWSDLAIARTTPALLGLFPFITLLAHRLTADQPLPLRSAAWYTKSQAPFSDVMAFVRRYLWTPHRFRALPGSHRTHSYFGRCLAWPRGCFMLRGLIWIKSSSIIWTNSMSVGCRPCVPCGAPRVNR